MNTTNLLFVLLAYCEQVSVYSESVKELIEEKSYKNKIFDALCKIQKSINYLYNALPADFEKKLHYEMSAKVDDFLTLSPEKLQIVLQIAEYIKHDDITADDIFITNNDRKKKEIEKILKSYEK